MKQPRGTQRYRPTQRDDEDTLTQAIVTLAGQYGRYGYRRITALLRRTGWQVGKDRVERIWRREGLKGSTRSRSREGGCGSTMAQRWVMRTAASRSTRTMSGATTS